MKGLKDILRKSLIGERFLLWKRKDGMGMGIRVIMRIKMKKVGIIRLGSCCRRWKFYLIILFDSYCYF